LMLRNFNISSHITEVMYIVGGTFGPSNATELRGIDHA
jgi:hypothetical protein